MKRNTIVYVFFWIITLCFLLLSTIIGFATFNYGNNSKANLIIGVAVGLIGMAFINFLVYLLTPIVILFWRILKHQPHDFLELISNKRGK